MPKRKKIGEEGQEWAYAIISEAAFYGFLYYSLRLLGASGNLFIHSLVLWVLLNIAIILCPLMRRYYER